MSTETITPHRWIPCLEQLLTILAELIGLVLTYITFKYVANYFTESFNSDYLLSIALLPALYILKSIGVIIEPLFIKIERSENHITATTGILTRRKDKIALNKIENVERVQTFLGRRCGYCTITLYAPGGWVKLPNIQDSDAQELEDKVIADQPD
ncbi:PH domain-containing protein [Pokkaliibacter sp. CJK22405]|uniref:PH domain-containing protein n=1 Tax=Pokkaliibacter sp. CJK22405 TaxID=3384615 RepID=UPI0039855135